MSPEEPRWYLNRAQFWDHKGLTRRAEEDRRRAQLAREQRGMNHRQAITAAHGQEVNETGGTRESVGAQIAALKALAEAKTDIAELKAEAKSQQDQIDALTRRLDAIGHEKTIANQKKNQAKE